MGLGKNWGGWMGSRSKCVGVMYVLDSRLSPPKLLLLLLGVGSVGSGRRLLLANRRPQSQFFLRINPTRPIRSIRPVVGARAAVIGQKHRWLKSGERAQTRETWELRLPGHRVANFGSSTTIGWSCTRSAELQASPDFWLHTGAN